MPLFLQPGFGIATTSVRLDLNEIDQVRLDVTADAEWADYTARPLATTSLDLLDRRSRGVEVGAAWGERTSVRLFGALRQGDYPNQKTNEPSDSTRTDRTVQAGFTWTMEMPITAQLGVEGTLNRSNSRRPEYDALSVRGVVAVPLPFDVGATVLGVWTAKSYLRETEFKLLVPGEEADNASVVYLDLSRALAERLDASLRLGWTRAEADMGDAYFQRFGTSLLLRYRPGSF